VKRNTATFDIVLAGRGGQGVIFLSRVMGQAALLQGLGVRTTATHGMAMRGGSVQCFVRFGEMLGPLVRTRSAHLLMVLHPGETSLALPLLGETGVVLINTPNKDPHVPPVDKKLIHTVDAAGIAREHGNPRSANLALLGGAVAMVEGFPLEAPFIEEAILASGPEKVVDINIEIFRQGLKN
jgi:indolepyruvate ferredoxin oxidoreductase beta subunit